MSCNSFLFIVCQWTIYQVCVLCMHADEQPKYMPSYFLKFFTSIVACSQIYAKCQGPSSLLWSSTVLWLETFLAIFFFITALYLKQAFKTLLGVDPNVFFLFKGPILECILLLLCVWCDEYIYICAFCGVLLLHITGCNTQVLTVCRHCNTKCSRSHAWYQTLPRIHHNYVNPTIHLTALKEATTPVRVSCLCYIVLCTL